ncbi:PAS domain-containing protein [Secundilactobacillus odoratitofui]|nr:PAS domain-containing protein [Secundilactobacillus odoratitofui]
MSRDEPYVKDAYINFPTGTLSFTQIQQIFSTMPFEIDLIDATDHFAWFSNNPKREHERHVDQLGQTLAQFHPAKVLPIVQGIIQSFRDGTRDVVSAPMVKNGHPVFTQYYAVRDTDGTYLGTMEFTGNVEQIIRFFENGAFDAMSSASQSGADATTSASTTATPTKAQAPSTQDATTGASETEAAPATPKAEPQSNDTSADATTGASEA